MAEFKYAPMFQLGEDTTQYYKIPGSEKLVKTTRLPDGKTLLEVSPEALTLVAQQSFHDCQFMLRRAHNEQVAAILNDPESFPSARTPAPPSSMAKRVRASGPISRTRRR